MGQETGVPGFLPQLYSLTAHLRFFVAGRLRMTGWGRGRSVVLLEVRFGVFIPSPSAQGAATSPGGGGKRLLP